MSAVSSKAVLTVKIHSLSGFELCSGYSFQCVICCSLILVYTVSSFRLQTPIGRTKGVLP